MLIHRQHKPRTYLAKALQGRNNMKQHCNLISEHFIEVPSKKVKHFWWITDDCILGGQASLGTPKNGWLNINGYKW